MRPRRLSFTRRRGRVGPVIAIVIGAVGLAVALAFFILASSVSDAAAQRAMWLGDSDAWEEVMAIKVVSGIGMVIFGIVILLGVLRYISASSATKSGAAPMANPPLAPTAAPQVATAPPAATVPPASGALQSADSTSPPAPGTMYCPQCGSPSSGLRFCSQCGRDLTSVREALK